MLIFGPQGDILIQTGDHEYLHIIGHVCAVNRRTRTVHALDADVIHDQLNAKSRRTTYDAVCGAKVRVMQVRDREVASSVLWPPRLSTLVDGVSRCDVCWEATGRKRPSKWFPAKVPV
jgi:methyl coenzyme M reductase subunit C-like uncharacterized protein (methanogenesis marker protein 7)